MEITLQWFSTPPMDIEYKYYKIMAEFQRISRKLEEYKIYPELLKIKEWKKEMERFLQKISRKNAAEPQEITWENNWENLLELIRFSYRNLSVLEQKAETYYREIREEIEVHSVGINSLYPYEGFLLLHRKKRNSLELYLYALSPVSYEKIPYFTLYWLGEKNYYHFSATEIKTRLHKYFRRRWSNPATFLVETSGDYPSYGAVLPVGLEKIYSRIRFISPKH